MPMVSKDIEALAKTFDAYHKDCPEDFYWAVGAQALVLLQHLFISLDLAPHSQESRGVEDAKERNLVV